MKRIFVIAISLVSIVVSTSIALAQDSVTLGIAERTAKLYNWGLGAGVILALGIIVYGGFTYVTSAGNASRIGDAKKWITAAITGLLILFSSFLILNTINPNLTNLQSIALSIQEQIAPSEGKIIISSYDLGAGVAGLVNISGTAQELAGAILDRAANPNDPHYAGDGRIVLSSDARDLTLRKIANGEHAAVNVCTDYPPVKCNTSIRLAPVSEKLLALILSAAEAGHSITISGITTRPHGTNSDHYVGLAVDVAKNDSLYRWLFAHRGALNIGDLIHCPPPGGTTTVNDGSLDLSWRDRCNRVGGHTGHIHVSVLR